MGRDPGLAGWSWAVLLSAVLILGCAPAPQRPSPDSVQAAWEQRRARLSELSEWRVVGRMALQNGDEAYHGHVDWRQDREGYRIRLNAPLGQGSVELQGKPGEVTLRSGDGDPIRAVDPNSLLREATGWRLPVAGLRWWVLGVPHPEGARPVEARLDDSGRLELLRQDGWGIEYRRYTELDGLELPDKVFLSRGDLRVRLVMERWSLAAAHPRVTP
jgi:outer membrane lipoprotein LolB